MRDFLFEMAEEFAYAGSACHNCGMYLDTVNGNNIAHILPKRIFKSVAYEPRNVMLLCTNFDRKDGKTGCHEQFDSSWSKAKTMPVWEMAKRQVGEIRDMVTEPSKILYYFDE